MRETEMRAALKEFDPLEFSSSPLPDLNPNRRMHRDVIVSLSW